MPYRRALPWLAASALAVAVPALADDFPPVTAEERALAAVPGEPNAPAVVLFRKGEFKMMDIARQEASSHLRVAERVKILNDQGLDRGEVQVAHSSFVRLSNFRGRTVLPDGRVVPLPADAKFVRKVSKAQKASVTSIAFPSVQVGAILDYSYDLRFDTFYFLEPWYFSDEIPVRHAEIVYQIPLEMGIQTWSRDPFRTGIKSEKSKNVKGIQVRAWADDLRPVPAEPFRLPFADLATQIMLLPTAFDDGTVHFRLMESWAATCGLLKESYDKARRRDGGVAERARQIAQGAGEGKRAQAAAIYRFVRDEIENADPFEGIFLAEGASVASALAKRRGDSAEKALLLESMLRAVKIEARPVWVAERGRGLIDTQLANPAWFHQVIVAAELDGKRVFLDPAHRSLGFGQLPAALEGTAALIPDAKKPEGIVLPETPFDQSRRRAALKLALDAQGRVTGTGTLQLTGHHATGRIHWREDAEKTAAAWKDWLVESLGDYAVSAVEVVEKPEERTVEVSWSMAQREEEALGDEATISPSRPLGPMRQPFALPASTRRSPVLFDFADRDEVELELTWPEGWAVEAVPAAAKHESDAGAVSAQVEVRAPERALTYRRRLDLAKKQFASREDCERVRALFGEAEKSDAQALVLVRR
jgi:transglutaminase-like putative cysteine protease